MKKFGLVIISFLITTYSFSQQDNEVNEIRLKLNEDGSHYIKATFLNQVWIRFNQSNPGSMVQSELTDQTFDIGLRRTRLQLFGQVTDRVFFYTQFGQNNFNALSQVNGNRKLQPFFHDALLEYNVFKENNKLKLGGGLTITNGLSRFSQPSVTSIATMDVPVFAQATVEQIDQFSRKLSLIARGQLGKVDYRLTLSDPFPINTNGSTPPPPGTNATFAAVGHTKQYQGFFMYNFFDQEGHTTPYMTGTYLGKKRVFNLEFGFITQKNATWTENAASDTLFHNLNLWSVALYYDAPLNEERGNAISAYAGYFNLDYGPGYLRYNGIMNPSNGLEPGNIPASQGNAFPMYGTGSVIYAHLGYMFSRDLLGERGTLMPYTSLMSADYAGLNDRMNVFAIGLNWLMQDHTSKISLDYQSRPVYEQQSSGLEKTESKGQVVLQYQVYF